MVDPNGCAHCGVIEREHMSRWAEGIGMHNYGSPSNSQRLERMKNRNR